MPMTGAFTVSQGNDISQFTLTDTSTTFDANISTRTIYLYKIDGTLLGGTTLNWAKVAGVTDTKTIDLLDKDYSLTIVVVWVVASPEVGGVYTKTVITTFVGYSNTFIYDIIQQMAANPAIASDTNFLKSLSDIQTFVDNAIQSTNFSDPYNAQSNLDRVYYIQSKQNFYF